MKKTALLLALLFSVSTGFAEEHHEHREGGHGGGPGWLVPLVIGGVLGWELRDQPPPPAAPIVVAPPVQGQPMQPVYTLQWVFDPGCNCYRQQYIQTGWR